MNRTWHFLLAGAIILLATFLRVHALAHLPPGLHFDEAFNATMAYRVMMGIERPIFFTEDMTEEPMAIYTTALAFALLGERTWTLRLVSAFAGILTVATLYALARALFRSRFIAALAAFILAILYWHINYSRLGMEPIFTPLMLTLAMMFLWRALHPPMNEQSAVSGQQSAVSDQPSAVSSQRSSVGGHRSSVIGQRSAVNIILAGIFLAATLYTYKAALFVPMLFVAFIVIEALVDRKFLAQNARALLFIVIIAILVFAPLGIYLATHPEQFFERPSSVAAFNLSTMLDHALKVAGMFFLRGDENPRSNLPGRPALDPFLAIGFIAGIAVCLARWQQRPARWLLLWLGVMSAPSIVTDFAPHFGRNIAATPAIALTTAYGLAWLADRRLPPASRLLRPATCFLLAGLAFSAFATARDYFAIWGARTGAFDSFDVGYLTLAQKLRDRPETIYLSPVDAHHYTIQFGLARRVVHSFDGRYALVLPSPNHAAVYGIITRDDPHTLARLQSLYADARVLETIYDFTGAPYAVMVRVEGTPRLAPQRIVNARIGNAIELIGYDVAREGESIGLTVYWRAREVMREDYTVFVHLVGAVNPQTQSPVWAQDDTQPARGSYPTSRWQRGEIIVDEYRLRVAGLPRGEYRIESGIYNLHTGARLRVLESSGAPMESDRVIFERITVP
jgi:4-amino-4-deoxy-L-arabinose transferase-like glycosyltransferase